MAQLEHMDTCLDTLTTELYQVNTRVSFIAQRQACIGGFTTSPSPSPSPPTSKEKDDDEGSGDDDDDEDEDEGANSSSDEKITASQ